VEWISKKGPGNLSDEVKSLLDGLLNKKWNSIELIKAHPYFKGINWSDLRDKKVEPPHKPILINKENSNNSNSNFDVETATFSAFDTNNFEAAPTLVAELKKGKFCGFTFVEPKKSSTSDINATDD